MSDPTRIDRYEVVEMLGKGSMGVLYRARDPATGNEVAVKILASELLSNARAVERFKREIRSSIQLEHPNLVAALAAGQFDGKYFYVMEYVDGATVKRTLRSKGPYEIAEAVSIATQVARALAYAGQFGIVHRDIKPENILVRSDGVAKLADMGLAKSVDSQNKLTLTGSVLGTPHYMSPEQARGDEDVDGRSDIYSLGATLFHMLCGRPPFDGDDPVSVITRLLAREPPRLREANPQLPERVESVVSRMMARDREKRFASAQELLAALDALEKDPAPEAGSDGPAGGRASPGPRARYRWVYVVPKLDLLAGLILVNSGAVTRDQIDRALDRQEQLAMAGIEVPLTDLLTEMNLITRDQRSLAEDTLTRHSIQAGLEAYVRAVAKSEFLSPPKMAEYRQRQQETNRPLGQILLESGDFTDDERRVLRALQQSIHWADEERTFIGAVVEQGLVGAPLAERALVIQNNRAVQGEYHEVGWILVQKRHLSEEQRRVLLRAVRRHALTGRAAGDLIVACEIEGAPPEAETPGDVER